MRLSIIAFFIFVQSNGAQAASSDCADLLVSQTSHAQTELLLRQYGLIWLDEDLGLLQVDPAKAEEYDSSIRARDVRVVGHWAYYFQRNRIYFRLPNPHFLRTHGTRLVSRPGRKEIVLGREFFNPADLFNALAKIHLRELKLNRLHAQGIITENYTIENFEGKLLSTQIHGHPESPNRLSRVLGKAEGRGIRFFLDSLENNELAVARGSKIYLNEKKTSLGQNLDSVIQHELVHATSIHPQKLKLHRLLEFLGDKATFKIFGYEERFRADEVEAILRELALEKQKLKATHQIGNFSLKGTLQTLTDFLKAQLDVLEIILNQPDPPVYEDEEDDGIGHVFTEIIYRKNKVQVNLPLSVRSNLTFEEKKALFLQTLEKRRDVVRGYLERLPELQKEIDEIRAKIRKNNFVLFKHP